MALPLNTVMETRIRYEVNDQVCYNVLHYVISAQTGAPTELVAERGFLNVIESNAAGGWPFELKQLQSANNFITEIAAQIVFPQRWRATVDALLIGGANLTICNAQNLAATVTKRGVFANRHNQGSHHVGGLPIDAYAQGALSPAWVTKVGNYITNFLKNDVVDAVNGVTWTPAILNREVVIVSGKKKYNITGASAVMEWFAQQTIRTQRTRTKGVGI